MNIFRGCGELPHRLPHQMIRPSRSRFLIERLGIRDPIVCARRGRHARERRLKMAIWVAG